MWIVSVGYFTTFRANEIDFDFAVRGSDDVESFWICDLNSGYLYVVRKFSEDQKGKVSEGQGLQPMQLHRKIGVWPLISFAVSLKGLIRSRD